MLKIVTFLFYILPIVSFLLFCLKKASRGLWVVFICIVCACVFDVFQRISSRENTFTIMGVFTILEFITFSYFFYISVTNKAVKRFIIFTSALVSFFLLFSFIRSDKNSFDSISTSVESIAFIIFSIIYFFEQLNKSTDHFIYSSPNFWVVLAVLIGTAATLFLFILANNLSEKEIEKYWIINNIASIVSNILFSIAFLVNRFVPQNPPSERSLYPNMPENHWNQEP